jgi:ribonuclease HI
MPYYAIANGRKTGVVQSWQECQAQVTGYSNARYKKFNTAAEAAAFVLSNGSSTSKRASTVDYSNQPSSSSYYASRSRVTKPKTTPYKPTTKNSPDMQHVYVDGASRGNGRVQNPKAGYGVYYGIGDKRNAAVPLSKVDGGRTVTNQRAELHAMNHALDDISQEISRGNAKEYTIHSDSQYTLKAINEWADKWKSKGWRTSSGEPVKNRDLIEKAVNKMAHINKEYEARGMPPVKLAHVAGHAGNHGNEMADQLANQGADND